MKIGSCRYWIGVFYSVAWGSAVFGVELPPGIIRGLGDSDYRVREVAQSRLLDWARVDRINSMEGLYAQVRGSDDPEVRERCLTVLRQMVFDQYLQEGKGFVGIGRDNMVAAIPGKLEPVHAVVVTSVRDGTPAEKAGIRVNDVIVSLNGAGWSDNNASNLFADQIAAIRPGTKVILGVLREGKLNDLEVILARRPLSADVRVFEGQGQDPDAMDRIAMENYFQEWLNAKRLQR